MDNSSHRRGSFFRLPFLMVALVLFSGCRMAPPEPLPVKMVWAGHQCGGPSAAPSAEWIDGPEKLDTAHFQRGAARAALGRGAMDWTRYGLIWIRMGQKPTGGFGLRLAASEAVVRKGVAVVTVQWREPPKGAFVTQMITSPCMVLKLPRGDYKEIVIEDSSGSVRARTDLRPVS